MGGKLESEVMYFSATQLCPFINGIPAARSAASTFYKITGLKEINLDDINLSCDSYNQVLDKFSVKESNISINQNDNNSIMDIII